MPKHQASLDFVVSEEAVSSQYDKDGASCCGSRSTGPSASGCR